MKPQKSSESAKTRIHNLIQQLDAETEVFFQKILTLADALEKEQGGRRYHIVMFSQLAGKRNLSAETYAFAVQCRSIEGHLRKKYLRGRINIIDELGRLLRYGYCDRADGRKGMIVIHPTVVEKLKEVLGAEVIQAASAVGVS